MPAALMAVALLSIVPGCGRKPKPAPPAADSGAGSSRPAASIPTFGGEPASYGGVLPCAGCPGIETALNLWPDGIYYLRQVPQGRAGASDEVGRWQLSAADSVLRLHGSGDEPRFYRLMEEGSIRQLDRAGRAGAPGPHPDLKRAAAFVAFEPRLRVQGIYQSLDSRAYLRDCVTGRPVRILPEASAAALQDAYLKADGGLEQELEVTIEARFVTRRAEGSVVEEPAVVVERIFAVGPGRECGARAAAPEVEGRFWRVTHVGSRPLGNLGATRRVPGFRLEPSAHRLVGFTTCNRIMGGYSLAGTSLRFSAVEATRAACPDGREFENALLQALGKSASFLLQDGRLELRDVRGGSLLRLEAVAGE